MWVRTLENTSTNSLTVAVVDQTSDVLVGAPAGPQANVEGIQSQIWQVIAGLQRSFGVSNRIQLAIRGSALGLNKS